MHRIHHLLVVCLVFTGVSTAAEPIFNRYTFEPAGTGPVDLGVAGPLAGYDNGALIFGGGANFPETEAPVFSTGEDASQTEPGSSGSKTYYSNVYVLPGGPKNENRWIEQKLRLPAEMGYSATVQTPKGVVCLGGETASGPVDDAFILRYDPKAGAVTLSELPKLPKPRTAASATLLGNRIYLLGGITVDDLYEGFSDEMISLDLDKPGDGWRPESKLPDPIGYGVAVTQSNGERNCIYLLGGRYKKPGYEVTRFSNIVYRYDAATKSWHEETRMPKPLAAGTGVSMGICSIFLFGGDDGEIFNANERRQAAIDTATDPAIKERRIDEKNAVLKHHPGFSGDVLLYNTITKVWTTPFQSEKCFPVTTTALSWKDAAGSCVVIPGGEIRPRVRTAEFGIFRVSGRSYFTILDYGILTVYMLSLLGLGFLFMRKEGSAKDFFLGGGRLPWWAVGISIFATTLSAITFLSVPAKAFAADWRMSLYTLGIIMVAPIIIRYYLPYFRNLNLDTAYDYLERRFNRLTRYLASGLFSVFMVTRIAIVLFLPSLALNVATGLDVFFCIFAMSIVTIVYCTLGGMEAVVWGDVIQGAILMGGALVSLVVLVFCTDGGLFGFFEAAYGAGKLRTFDFRFDFTQPVFWVVMLGAFFNNIVTYSSDQTLVQRYMCGTDPKQSIRSIWLNAILAIPVILIFFPLGTALFTYYRSHPGAMDATLSNPDAIYPLFIVNGLPPGVSGIVIAAIFAAAMSTLSSNINSASAAISSDFLKQWFPKLLARRPVLVPQIVGVVVGLLGTLLALLLATCDIKSLWDQFNVFLGLITGPVAGLFLMGIFSRRINGTGAVTGLLTAFGVMLFLETCVPRSIRPSFLLYGMIGIILSYLVGYVTSLFVGGPAKTITLPDRSGIDR